ncbi:hypothetical protein SAMN05443574_103328 [Haloarcula vallismortis]|uniref:DUF6908 domain-containing protein n=2 Tax=Haloarcula vallismortis TaxID=28442 RepID=M0JTA4_HALVA|nr:hypothetical protein [Haloarcula vallismortis]EMA11588.1 hypothetical protein C437_01710 [Haloarcula vallismortis ATCC 29715]SDW45677.1 hypothetical protein SAMN05443574_103328 [Haloarcula vallismortis]
MKLEAVQQILEEEGTSIEEMEVNESYSYDGGEAFNDLSIEKVYDNVLSVEQHYTQRMDRMSDPEVRFDVSDPDNWMPIEYRQDPGLYRRDEEDGLEMDDFLKTWDKNLQNQFPAEEVTGGDER